MASEKSPKVVAVAGDVTLDWNIARTPGHEQREVVWSAEDTVRVGCQPGGAALLTQLASEIAGRLGGWEIHDETQVPDDPIPGAAGYNHAFANWFLFEDGSPGKKSGAWRVESHLGLDRVAPAPPCPPLRGLPRPPDIVVLNDANLGFRKRPECWEHLLEPAGHGYPKIVLKMSRPMAEGELWERLSADCADRLSVVMTVEDVRLRESQISRELSWERTAQNLAAELVGTPLLNELSRCAHAVVSFTNVGALILSGAPGDGRAKVQKPEDAEVPPEFRLLFDPSAMEGMWGSQYEGGLIGYTSCLVAGILHQLMAFPEEPDIAAGVQGGLAAMRALHVEGYRDISSDESRGALLCFPKESVVETVMGVAERLRKETTRTEGTASFAEARVPLPERRLPKGRPQTAADAPREEPPFWSILRDSYSGDLEDVAKRVALDGPEGTLVDVPRGQFGALLTVDRREIEGFHSIRSLVAEYCGQSSKAPLSIAVFGAPGSGKSFAIEQVAESLPRAGISRLTFNLSQLGDAAELHDAFHQVRDAALSGEMPLVFWDEFDAPLGSQPLGWLRHFLAPMQDGAFLERQIPHPMGRAVFVFAGGVAHTFDEFVRGKDPETSDGKALEEREEAFRERKGPDFVSRLKGYVNILGPDPAEGGEPDPYYVLRRAILLRSVLRRTTDGRLFRKAEGAERLDIDPGVLRAFLEVPRYRHGTRSLQAIVAMSSLSGKSRYERSCLPATDQLDIHVDGDEFMALVSRREPE